MQREAQFVFTAYLALVTPLIFISRFGLICQNPIHSLQRSVVQRHMDIANDVVLE